LPAVAISFCAFDGLLYAPNFFKLLLTVQCLDDILHAVANANKCINNQQVIKASHLHTNPHLDDYLMGV
jgi:hypothetical protein